MGEGMPQYKNPFEKGQLIVQFLVDFPDSIAADKIAKLEACLPPRSVVISFDYKSLSTQIVQALNKIIPFIIITVLNLINIIQKELDSMGKIRNLA